jgi:hypothetical protein
MIILILSILFHSRLSWFRICLVLRLILEVQRCNLITHAVNKLDALLECDIQLGCLGSFLSVPEINKMHATIFGCRF